MLVQKECSTKVMTERANDNVTNEKKNAALLLYLSYLKRQDKR